MDFMATQALIETGVISILFVFHAAPWAYLCYMQNLYGNERFEKKKRKRKNQQKCILFL